MFRLHLLAVFIVLFSNPIFSQTTLSPVIVSESLFEQDLDQALSSNKIIEGQRVEDLYFADVSRALESQSSFHFAQNGGVGQYSSMWFRGNNSSRLLVLVDGVEMNDPTEGSRSAIFETLNFSQIESIEILKGAQSGIYGADSMSGVIHIITKDVYKNENKFLFEAGSFGRRRLGIKNQKKFGSHWYQLNFDTLEVDGVSAALNGAEADYFNRHNLALKHQYKKDNFKITSQMKVIASMTEIDRGAGVSSDDPNNESRINNLFLATNIEMKNDQALDKLLLQYSQFDRNYQNFADALNSTVQKDNFAGDVYKVQWARSLKKLIFGLELENESMNSLSAGTSFNSEFKDRQIEAKSAFAEYRVMSLEQLNHSLSMRYDDFSNGNEVLTYRLLNKYQINQTSSLGVSYATGFKNPTLYQLYDSSSGNSNLESESSKDLQVFYKINAKNWVSEINFFRQKIDDLITWNTTYQNLGYFEIDGVEFENTFYTAFAQIDFSITKLSISQNDQDLTDRPREKIVFSLYRDGLFYRYLYVGNRSTLPSYSTSDIGYKHRLEQGDLNFKLNNIFNRDFQEVLGYTTYGINFVVQYNLNI